VGEALFNYSDVSLLLGLTGLSRKYGYVVHSGHTRDQDVLGGAGLNLVVTAAAGASPSKGGLAATLASHLCI